MVGVEGQMSFRILSTGRCVPEKVVTNDELSEFLDTSDEWISQRVGISSRHISVTETAGDLAAGAARAALDAAGCAPEELDLILAATVSGETVAPSVSCIVQRELGATCMAFDINAACSAFLFLMETAAGFFARGMRRILIVGAERMSRIVDWRDRSTCVIFGDGAGAALLEADETNLYASKFCVTGDDKVICIPQSVGNSPYYRGEEREPYTMMNGQETFKFAVNSMCRDLPGLLEEQKLGFDDVRYIIPHQANSRIIELACRKLRIPLDKMAVNIERYGNTSSASIPIVLDELNREGKLSRGDLLLFCAFGGGLASAASILRW